MAVTFDAGEFVLQSDTGGEARFVALEHPPFLCDEFFRPDIVCCVVFGMSFLSLLPSKIKIDDNYLVCNYVRYTFYHAHLSNLLFFKIQYHMSLDCR